MSVAAIYTIGTGGTVVGALIVLVLALWVADRNRRLAPPAGPTADPDEAGGRREATAESPDGGRRGR